MDKKVKHETFTFPLHLSALKSGSQELPIILFFAKWPSLLHKSYNLLIIKCIQVKYTVTPPSQSMHYKFSRHFSEKVSFTLKKVSFSFFKVKLTFLEM